MIGWQFLKNFKRKRHRSELRKPGLATRSGGSRKSVRRPLSEKTRK